MKLLKENESMEEKESNREIFKQRIVVEHHIGVVKRVRIVHDTFRNRKKNYVDVVMETSCGLHNFRFTMRHRKVA